MDEDFVRRLFGADVQPYLVAVKLIKKDGRFAGYGFLDFSSREAAQQVLNNYSGRPIALAPNKVYRLNWASGHITGGTGQAAKQLAGNTGGELYSVFVGDLSSDVTDYVLLSAFQQRYASVKGAKVIMDNNTQQSKGFGFVKFSEENDMMRAMEEMTGQFIGSRPVKVAPASNSKKPSGPMGGYGGASTSSSSYGSSSMNSGGYSQYGGGGSYHQPSSGHSMSHRQQDADGGNTTIYVGNLDGNTTDENVLRHTFSIYGPILSVKIPSNNRHCGFVQFADRSQAERAMMEMNGARIQGNVVRVSWGKQGSKKPQQSQHPYQQQQQQQQYQSYPTTSMMPTTGAYSVSPVPVQAQAPSPAPQVTTPQQSQQQQYAAYMQWQQQMLAYNQMQPQTTQESTAEPNQQSVISEYQDSLPSDYFTKPFNVENDNANFIQHYGAVFTSSSLVLEYT